MNEILAYNLLVRVRPDVFVEGDVNSDRFIWYDKAKVVESESWLRVEADQADTCEFANISPESEIPPMTLVSYYNKNELVGFTYQLAPLAPEVWDNMISMIESQAA